MDPNTNWLPPRRSLTGTVPPKKYTQSTIRRDLVAYHIAKDCIETHEADESRAEVFDGVLDEWLDTRLALHENVHA